MEIDFAKCRICDPEGDKGRLEGFYNIQRKMFPYDRPVYDEMLAAGKKFYTLENYALYSGEEFLGNVGLFPVSIWFEDEVVEVVGVGAVSTAEGYRKKGICRYLMRHCMKIIDEREKAAVLFTEVPAVYQEHGFAIVEQDYMGVPVDWLGFSNQGFEYELFEKIGDCEIEQIKNIYDKCPDYDGKIVRDEDYWQFYQLLFNPYSKQKIVFCRSGNEAAGYVRFDVERDRLSVTEFCTPANATDVISSLLFFVADLAEKAKVDLITVALTEGHFIWDFFKSDLVGCAPEPGGVRRESFMVRAVGGGELGRLGKLQWSLADKF